jgi:hypothetical protein
MLDHFPHLAFPHFVTPENNSKQPCFDGKLMATALTCSDLHRYCVSDAHFPWRKNCRIDASALFVLLRNAPKNCGTRFGACWIKGDHHATLVDFRDSNPRRIPDAKNPTNPVQLIESFAAL